MNSDDPVVNFDLENLVVSATVKISKIAVTGITKIYKYW